MHNFETFFYSDGAKACGLFIALSFVTEKIKLEQECDVCLAVRTVRRNRKQFVTEMVSIFIILQNLAVILKIINNFRNNLYFYTKQPYAIYVLSIYIQILQQPESNEKNCINSKQYHKLNTLVTCYYYLVN